MGRALLVGHPPTELQADHPSAVSQIDPPSLLPDTDCDCARDSNSQQRHRNHLLKYLNVDQP